MIYDLRIETQDPCPHSHSLLLLTDECNLLFVWMRALPFFILTLSTSLCLPLFETDPVFVVTDELSEGSLEAFESSGLERSADHDATETMLVGGNSINGKTCKVFDVCYGDEDCHGGKCLGSFVGKCNCHACLDFWMCESDDACGGLNGACNKITKTCDCHAGFKAAGFPFFVDALRGLCNRKSCNGENAIDKCFGLPCRFGRCSC